MIELYLLLIFMIIAAFIAVEAKDLLSSVVALAAAGLGLSLVFIILKAPDVAMTQLIVETLALIILIRATVRVDLPFSVSGRWVFNTTVTAIFILSFLFFAFQCLKFLPPFGYPLMRVAGTYLKEGFLKTGETNIVSSIGLDYRVLDTLGEATVLFTAVIGVMAIVRRIGRKKGDQVVREEDE